MDTLTNLPEFIGKPLTELPELKISANFLRGDFGKAVLKEYLSIVSTDYKDNPNLKVLSYNWQEDVVSGSNQFAAVLVNRIVGTEGLRTATLADLERMFRVGALNPEKYYKNVALVLRTRNRDNNYLANNLADQIKQRTGKEFGSPIMVSLCDLDLITDRISIYGLAFKLKDSANLIHAPILNEISSFFEDVDGETGLPKKLGKGSRWICTVSDGLSWLNLNGNLSIDAAGYDFTISNQTGRVIVISDEIASNQSTSSPIKEIKRNIKELAAVLEEFNVTCPEELRAALKSYKSSN